MRFSSHQQIIKELKKTTINFTNTVFTADLIASSQTKITIINSMRLTQTVIYKFKKGSQRKEIVLNPNGVLEVRFEILQYSNIIQIKAGHARK